MSARGCLPRGKGCVCKGVSAQGGCLAVGACQEGVSTRGACVCKGVCLPERVYRQGGVSTREGVSAMECVYKQGCVFQGVCVPDTPPLNRSQTGVKTLPCRNYVTDSKN